MARALPDPREPPDEERQEPHPAGGVVVTWKRSAGLLIVALCAVPTAGCTGGDTPGTTAAAESPAPAPAGPQAPVPKGPLELALGYSPWPDTDGTDPVQEERERTANLAYEEALATCMRDQGFEYTPAPAVSTDGAPTEQEDTSTREWAEQFGYGIYVQTDAERALAAWYDANPVPPDPNEAYVDAMSDAEKDAYDRALQGDAADGTVDAPQDPDADQGCTGRAQEEVYADFYAAVNAEEWTAFNDDFAALTEEIFEDPAVENLDKEWAACMDESGQGGFLSPDNARDFFWQKSSDLVQATDVGEDPVRDPAIEDRERAIAVADWDCKRTLDYDAKVRAVQFAKEQAYVDSHAELIEAVKGLAAQMSL